MIASRHATPWIMGLATTLLATCSVAQARDNASLSAQLEEARQRVLEAIVTVDDIETRMASLESRLVKMLRAAQNARTDREYRYFMQQATTLHQQISDLYPGLHRAEDEVEEAQQEVKRIQRALERCPTC